MHICFAHSSKRSFSIIEDIYIHRGRERESENTLTEDQKSAFILRIMGSLSNCRFYENQFPAIDELVVVQVTQIAEMGVYVKLLEYDNIEGMILLSELSRRRIQNINKHIRSWKK